MKQSTILKYAMKHLSEKIEKLNFNLTCTRLSEAQRKLFEGNLDKYTQEYDKMGNILDRLKKEMIV